MRSTRALALTLAMGAIVAAPPAAGAKTAPVKAHASGTDAVELIYPSLVRSRVNRAYRALDRAGRKIDNGQLDKVPAALKVVRRQTAAAWRGTKYVIRTTPPPPAQEDAFRPRARKTGDPVGPTYAAPADTGYKVLELMHDVSAEMVQQIDGSHGTGLAPISRTLNWVNDRRDQAIQYIFSVAPPAPATEDAFRPRARKSGDPVVGSTFDTVMPNYTAELDDELQAINGLKTDATDLTTGGRRLLNAAQNQIEKTRTFVATTWPLLPPED